MDKISLLSGEWDRARKGAVEYIQAMPEEGLNFKPSIVVRSFAEQYLHIAGANYAFASAIGGLENPYNTIEGKDPEKMDELKRDRETLIKFVSDSYDFMIRVIRDLSEEELEEEVNFFKLKMSRHLLLAKALEHHAHHRGQTTVYLRLQGITPPGELLF